MRMFNYDWPEGWEDFSRLPDGRLSGDRWLKFDPRRFIALLNPWMTPDLWDAALGKPGCVVDDLECEIRFHTLIVQPNRAVLDARGEPTNDWFVMLSGNRQREYIIGQVTQEFADLVTAKIMKAREEAKELLELRDAELTLAIAKRVADPLPRFWAVQCSPLDITEARKNAIAVLANTGTKSEDLFSVP